YELAHIPGAVNIGAKALFTADKLAMIPADKPVVVYCYTGQTSSQVVSVLNMLGYDAKSLLFGFPSWAYVEGLKGPKPFDRAVDGHDYMVSTEAVEASGSFDQPAPLADTVAAAAEAYFSKGTKNIKASDVFENLNDGDASNDPFLIDVRKPEDYAAGHIPGAVNMSAKTFFTPENLAKIPADKQIVVNCYTGQTASQVVSVLNMLGYDAYNLKFGFAAWSPSGVYKFNVADSPMYRFEGTGVAAEAPAAEAPATAEQAPATLPVSGGVPVDFNWVYFLVGGGLLGAGVYLRRK
ncbi:MAG: rhodanese-like domain-containing protein, partial [Chloroflexi bacterium]